MKHLVMLGVTLFSAGLGWNYSMMAQADEASAAGTQTAGRARAATGPVNPEAKPS